MAFKELRPFVHVFCKFVVVVVENRKKQQQRFQMCN